MRKTSYRIYAWLILLLSISAFVFVLLPAGEYSAGYDLPATKPILGLVNALIMLVVYGGVGLLGLRLAEKNGYPDLWNNAIKKDILRISAAGIAIGMAFVAFDLLFKSLSSLPGIPHPPFPASIFASINAGIGEEILFRLFFISFWFWLISKKVESEKGREVLFWVLAAASAASFAIGHLPSVMLLYGYTSPTEIPAALMSMIFGLNGILSVAAAYYFRRYGILAAMLIHFWADIAWHVFYGVV